MQHSDIIEIRIYDSTYQIFYKGSAKIKDKKEMNRLFEEIKTKGINLIGDGWFD